MAPGLTDAQAARGPFVGPHIGNAHPRAICGNSGVTARAATRFALERHLS